MLSPLCCTASLHLPSQCSFSKATLLGCFQLQIRENLIPPGLSIKEFITLQNQKSRGQVHCRCKLWGLQCHLPVTVLELPPLCFLHPQADRKMVTALAAITNWHEEGEASFLPVSQEQGNLSQKSSRTLRPVSLSRTRSHAQSWQGDWDYHDGFKPVILTTIRFSVLFL